MSAIRPLRVLTAAVVAALCAGLAHGGTVVLANRSGAKVDFTLVPLGGKPEQRTIAADDVLALPADEKLGIAFDGDGTPRRYMVPANSVQYFCLRDGRLDLTQIALPPVPQKAPPPATGKPNDATLVIPVMILVDQHEPAVRQVWEKRLRDRLKQASDVFERCCRVRFEVVAVGTWQSNDANVDFSRAIRDFENRVNPAPARLAIGFTSYYKLLEGPTRVGGTRGPLHSHILVREWPNRVGRVELLQILIHEMGHFLGAGHSAEGTSVMRPMLGDQRGNARSFRIGFDPLNVLAMNLFVDEMRAKPLRELADVRPEAKTCLRAIYKTLGESLPTDPAAQNYLELLDQPRFIAPDRIPEAKPLIEDAQTVLRAVVVAARQNAQLPAVSASGSAAAARLSGDKLTELYIRRAATAAHELPADRGQRAFLLGIGIALDDATLLRDVPVLGGLWRLVEPDQLRMQRLVVLGSPTVQGRHDLAQHFAVSCALTALAGGEAAESAGVLKELRDMYLGNGFSFRDLAADLAGVAFAGRVLDKKLPLAVIATSFSVENYVPAVQDLPEGIVFKRFGETYGSAGDVRFQRRKEAIRQRILALPGYKGAKGEG